MQRKGSVLEIYSRRPVGRVPRLRRSSSHDGYPVLPDWADLWRSALQALRSLVAKSFVLTLTL